MQEHGTDTADPLARALARARAILPDQGPIGVFIHHNTLHAFQHQSFHAGVQRGAALLGARPYPESAWFLEQFRTGRIDPHDLDTELEAALGPRAEEPLAIGLTRRGLWRFLMTEAEDEADEAGTRFLLETGTASPCDRPSFEAARRCIERAGARPIPGATPPRRHRDALLLRGGADVDDVLHPELVRLCSSFLDQGQAAVALPHRRQGFLRAVARLAASGFPMPSGCPGVAGDFQAVLDDVQIDAAQVVRATLRTLAVDETDLEDFVLATLLALPGWAGMFARLEHHPTEANGGAPTTLLDYLAVRLLLERRAIERVAGEIGASIDWNTLRGQPSDRPAGRPTVDAVLLARLAHAARLPADRLETLPADGIQALWSEIAAFPQLERRRLWLEAYERTYRRRILDAMAAHRPRSLRPTTTRPAAQFVFCIDEREESIRRALEEQGPHLETFGVAGFFGLAIDFTGLDDHAPAAHCPVVTVPAHEVFEHPVAHDEARHLARTAWRDAWHRTERAFSYLSRSLAGGAGLALALGPIAGFFTATRVFLPRSSITARRRFEASMAPRPATRLSPLRVVDAPSARGKHIGFSLDEAVDRVEGVLRNIGLVEHLAPIVVLCGHGSTSLNNPHESAHDCGACGGRRGGANARLFADIANQTDVRDALARRGLAIPDDTWFVGALHDTSDDGVTFYDLDAMPADRAAAFAIAEAALDQARRESARERCRRFDDVPLGITPDQALAHVQARASHLAQPRPEYGHCTNAMAIVGRRALTRGLHLDRRAFLVSYDPTIDPEHVLLERILAAVGPVGAGISLEYYFSAVDNEVFGCGTKLPHNVTALLGVMNGHQGDLRTGLPLQMVELHEPMRLLLIVEATTDALLGVAARQAEVRELVVNRWVQLISIHPESGAMHVFENGGFVPYTPAPVPLPIVQRSVDWHGRARGHLTPAVVTAALGETS